MANRRNAKKDILFFVEEALTDCLIFLELHPDKEYPEVEAIIDDIEVLYAKSIYKVNHAGKEEKKNMKKYYDDMYNELLDGIHHVFEKLSQLAKA